MKAHTVALKVCSAEKHDWYMDTARINIKHRPEIGKGRVHLLLATTDGGKPLGKKQRIFLRGTDDEGVITLDYEMRERLGRLHPDGRLQPNKTYNFTLVHGSYFDDFIWAWNSSDPAYRIATRIAVILGVISLILGVTSLVIALPPFI